MKFLDYCDNNILTQANLDDLMEVLNKYRPAGVVLSRKFIGDIFQIAYDLKMIIPKYEYDNQVEFNKQLKVKLKNIDK